MSPSVNQPAVNLDSKTAQFRLTVCMCESVCKYKRENECEDVFG